MPNPQAFTIIRALRDDLSGLVHALEDEMWECSWNDDHNAHAVVDEDYRLSFLYALDQIKAKIEHIK